MKELPDIHQSRWTRWHVGIVACVFAVVFIISLRSYTDPDLWRHLRFGLDVIEQRRIVQVDPYSYLTEGYRWINHEWLMEVLMGIAWIIDYRARYWIDNVASSCLLADCRTDFLANSCFRKSIIFTYSDCLAFYGVNHYRLQ